MRKNSFRNVLLASAALTVCLPGTALADTAKEKELEARIEALESSFGTMKSELEATKAENAKLREATARAEAKASEAALAQAKPAPATAPVDGFKSGGTTIKLGGFIKLIASSTHYSDGEVATNSLGRDFYLPQTIPTGGQPAAHDTDFSAKQSRFWLNLDTSISGHVVKGYLEFDFQTAPGTQGSQRTTNGYNPSLRRAYMQIDRWTFGQDWSTFQYTGALPESTDFVGGAEGTVFVRQPLIRYSAPLGKGTALHIGIENPESGTANIGSPTLIENGDDRLPDFAARLTWTGKGGELSLGGLARQVRVENLGVSATTGGYGVSLGGKLFFNDAKTGDARMLVTYGRNIGRYVGLNFAPDGVYVPATNQLESANVFAVIGAVRVPVAPGVRVNLMGSYQNVDYADVLTLANVGTFNQHAWSTAANLFYSPVKNIDLGVEYRHGERELVNGADGSTDRIEVVAKYSF